MCFGCWINSSKVGSWILEPDRPRRVCGVSADRPGPPEQMATKCSRESSLKPQLAMAIIMVMPADGYGDGHGAVSAAQSNYCAVCYSPTATRCAKFNAVHYCSGKCQIIHWRQDHKDECHPRPIKCDFNHKPSKQEKDFSCESNLQDESSLWSKSAALLNGESKPVDSTEASKVKHSNLDAELKAERSSESSGTGFTGFSSSSTSNESSDDVSICDSISSNDSIVRSRKADEVNAAAEAVYSEVADLSPDTGVC